ncbi:small hydrophobic protein [Streptomyces sp. NBC_00696]|uniref:small hydrophobic protein n=1 Tax=Streptomyces sp. NBC_00696 TaxID=2903672 RepID=UPI002E31BFC2|nr:small hydrophobic protein [Streptomyces sp. NBC_00696]
MTGLGNGTRKYPRSRGRMRSGTGPDRATLGIIGLICAIAGFFTLGLLLGPIALICGWLSMGRRWTGSRSLPPLIALILGAIDTLAAIMWTFF